MMEKRVIESGKSVQLANISIEVDGRKTEFKDIPVSANSIIITAREAYVCNLKAQLLDAERYIKNFVASTLFILFGAVSLLIMIFSPASYLWALLFFLLSALSHFTGVRLVRRDTNKMHGFSQAYIVLTELKKKITELVEKQIEEEGTKQNAAVTISRESS